jgi:hypothetical protein
MGATWLIAQMESIDMTLRNISESSPEVGSISIFWCEAVDASCGRQQILSRLQKLLLNTQ